MLVPNIDKTDSSWLEDGDAEKKFFEMDSKLTKCAVKKTIPAIVTNTISKINVARSFFVTMTVI